MKQALTTPFGNTKVYSSDSPDSDKHILVVPGFSESVPHNRGLVGALSDRGFNAFTFSQPRRKGGTPVAGPIERQGEIILSVLEATIPGGDKVHGVAHSLGSAALLKAAQQAPELFASLTLMQPVGMVGEQSFPELLGRVGKKVTMNQLGALGGQDPGRPETGYKASVDEESAIHYSGRVAWAQLAGSVVIAEQPALAIEEASAVGSYDIADDLAAMKAMKAMKALKIPVNIVTAHSDEMFDTAEVDEKYAGIAKFVDSYSSVADPTARHDTFWMQPERTARIVDELLYEPIQEV